MKRWIGIFAVAILGTTACNKGISPQDSSVAQEAVTTQNYIFNVESVQPMGGRSIPMTSGYDLVISRGSVTATLPYFGRAYFPPTDPTQGGFRFTSNKFRYNATSNDKGGWNIQIVPEDVENVQELHLTIGADGYSSLHVNSINRQSISYYGYISKNKVATQ